MTSQNKVGNNAVIISLSRVSTLVVSMIISMILSRYRTLEEYGTYSQILMVVNIFSSLIMLGLPNSINFFLPQMEDNEKKQEFLSIFYTLNTILSIIVGFSLILTVNLISSYFDNHLIINYLYFLALFPWTRIIMQSIENILVVYEKVKVLFYYRLSNAILIIGILALSQLYKLDFWIYLLLYLFAEVIYSVLVYLIVYKIAGKISFRIQFKYVKKIFVFSIPIGLASMLGTINVELSKLVIGNKMGTEKLAIFTNASKELPVTIIAASITSVLLPQIVTHLKNDNIDKAIKKWHQGTILAFILIAFIAAGCFVFASEVMSILYSNKYVEGTSVFRITSIVLIFRSTYFGMFLNATGKTKFILLSSFVMIVSNLILSIAFFELLGFNGPAYASLVSIIFMQLAQLIGSSKVLKVKMALIFPWKRLFYILLTNIIFGFAFYYIKKYTTLEKYIGEVKESIVLGAVWGGLYIIFFYRSIIRTWKDFNR